MRPLEKGKAVINSNPLFAALFYTELIRLEVCADLAGFLISRIAYLTKGRSANSGQANWFFVPG